MSAIQSGLSAITSCFNVITATAQAAETLANTGRIWTEIAEGHAQFHADKAAKKNELRLTLLDQRIQREIQKEDSFL